MKLLHEKGKTHVSFCCDELFWHTCLKPTPTVRVSHDKAYIPVIPEYDGRKGAIIQACPFCGAKIEIEGRE